MTSEETTGPRIRTRADLLHYLTEAAEVEHNLMCTYLYAVFGLKRSTDEGLSEEEALAVEAWRSIIMGVAIEEMTHLALVSNLFCALGARPHFDRPNFPVYPGTHPADIVVRLTPFDLDTLDHFIFLERPHGSDVKDSPAFATDLSFERVAAVEGVMPTSSDYATVGELYAAIREALERLAREHGEAALFVGSPAYQGRPGPCGAARADGDRRPGLGPTRARHHRRARRGITCGPRLLALRAVSHHPTEIRGAARRQPALRALASGRRQPGDASARRSRRARIHRRA